jgi:hypothetical protein
MKPTVRHLSVYVALTREEFRERFFARFYDPAQVSNELERVFEVAFDGSEKYRKSPRLRTAKPRPARAEAEVGEYRA